MSLLQIILLLIILTAVSFYCNENGIKMLHAFGQNSSVKIVTITKGSANPEVDITKLTQKQWYDPSPITINVNDTVKWINNDAESHTVTSGIGGGIISTTTTTKVKPDGLFNSGILKPGDSWSFKFNKSGTYNYFCTIHPWMEGIVNVKGESSQIPSYAVDQYGHKINKFPLYGFDKGKKLETGLSWAPLSIKTNEPINFIMDFYKMPQNEPLHLWPYNFILIQNGKEIYRTNGITQLGSSIEKYVFNSAGKLVIKLENRQDPSSFVEYNTIVYKNPNLSSFNNKIYNTKSAPGLLNSLTIIYSIYAVIIGIPLALFVFIILIKKRII